MNEIFQAKVLLTLYKNLQGAIRENEKKVLKCAGRGFYTHGADDTMKLYEKNNRNEFGKNKTAQSEGVD